MRATIRRRASMSPAISSCIPISCPSRAPRAYPALARRGRPAHHRHARRSGLCRGGACAAWTPRRAKRRWPICCCCWSASRTCAPSTRMCGRSRFCPAGGLALIRCDGGGKFGYGHVKRMVALARALARPRRHRRDVRAQRHATMPRCPIRRAGFEVTMMRKRNAIWPALIDATVSPICCCWMAAKAPRAPNWKNCAAISP